MEDNRVMECLDCRKKSDTAYWIGSATLADGSEVVIEGIVGFDGDTEYLDLDPLLEKFEDVEGFDGEAYCPFCKSINFI